MNVTKQEAKILQRIAKTHLVTKPELEKLFDEGDGRDIGILIDSNTKTLLEKKFITKLNLGSMCYVITKRGKSFLQDLE